MHKTVLSLHLLLHGIATNVYVAGNASLRLTLVKKLEYFSNLQHSDGFDGHSFSLKTEGRLQTRVAQFRPESVAQISPE